LVLVEGKMKDEKLMVELIDVPGAAEKEGGTYIPSPQVCDSMSYEETIIVRTVCACRLSCDPRRVVVLVVIVLCSHCRLVVRAVDRCVVFAEGDGRWWRQGHGGGVL
jgi:hypothetical protein